MLYLQYFYVSIGTKNSFRQFLQLVTAQVSVRKTSISRLLDVSMPENSLGQLSCHKSIQSLKQKISASEQVPYILRRTPQEARNLSDTVDSHHLPKNQTPTTQLITTESVQQAKSISSISGYQLPLFNGPVKINYLLTENDVSK